MPAIVTYSPIEPPARTRVEGPGKSLAHECRDAGGHTFREVFPLGSVRGIFYLDALCPHCGAHLVWVENDENAADAE